MKIWNVLVCSVAAILVNSLVSFAHAAPLFEELMRKKGEALIHEIEAARARRAAVNEIRELSLKKAEWDAAAKEAQEETLAHRQATETWEAADGAVKTEMEDRAKTFRAELEDAANQTGKEERVERECGATLSGAFKDAACFCISTYIKTKALPDADKIAHHVLYNVSLTNLKCVNGRISTVVAQRTHECVGKLIKRTFDQGGKKLLGEVFLEQATKGNPDDDSQRRALLFLRCFCH